LFPDTRDFLIWEIACCSFSAGNNQNYGLVHTCCLWATQCQLGLPTWV
jgi:hypothetical protein